MGFKSTITKDIVPKLKEEFMESEESLDDSDIILKIDSGDSIDPSFIFTAYKTVDKKVKPISTNFPEDYYIHRCISEDSLLTLSPLPCQPPEFLPTRKTTNEWIKILEINDDFLWPEEEMLFKHIMILNEEAIAFEDSERGTLKESYFSPYIIPTVPHVPWECQHIPMYNPVITSQYVQYWTSRLALSTCDMYHFSASPSR